MLFRASGRIVITWTFAVASAPIAQSVIWRLLRLRFELDSDVCARLFLFCMAVILSACILFSALWGCTN